MAGAELPARELDLTEAAAVLTDGGVLLLPTDTLPGFHCRADRPEAVQRIRDLKGRDGGKPLLVLAGDEKQAARVHRPLQQRQLEFCRHCWPGPFTLILPADDDLDQAVLAGGKTVGIRVPGLAPLRSLLLDSGFPLVSTSVNREGRSPLAVMDQCLVEFGDQVDGFVGGDLLSGPTRGKGHASALVDLTVWPPATLRAGPVEPPSVSD